MSLCCTYCNILCKSLIHTLATNDGPIVIYIMMKSFCIGGRLRAVQLPRSFHDIGQHTTKAHFNCRLLFCMLLLDSSQLVIASYLYSVVKIQKVASRGSDPALQGSMRVFHGSVVTFS